MMKTGMKIQQKWQDIKRRSGLSAGEFCCLLCGGTAAEMWCEGCHRDMFGEQRYCDRCARPLDTGEEAQNLLPSVAATPANAVVEPAMQNLAQGVTAAGRATGMVNTAATVCGQCATNPPVWQECRFLYPYQYPAQILVWYYKYAGRSELARSFARYFSRQLPLSSLSAVVSIGSRTTAQSLPQQLLPVPLHGWRQWRRGFNQAAGFAQALAQRLDIPWSARMLRRRRITQPQVGMRLSQRRRNLHNAFVLNGTRFPAHVALVDDVVTTGATANALAGMLRNAGVARVDLWVIARTARQLIL